MNSLLRRFQDARIYLNEKVRDAGNSIKPECEDGRGLGDHLTKDMLMPACVVAGGAAGFGVPTLIMYGGIGMPNGIGPVIFSVAAALPLTIITTPAGAIAGVLGAGAYRTSHTREPGNLRNFKRIIGYKNFQHMKEKAQFGYLPLRPLT